MKDQEMVLFIYGAMSTVGGIETYIYKQMKQLRSAGVKVGWLRKKNASVAQAFQELFLDEDVLILEKAATKTLRRFAQKHQIRTIKIIVFSVFDYATAEMLKANLSEYTVHTFYFVPHFCGAAYYPEEAFQGKKADCVKKRMATIFQKLYANASLLYFSDTHIVSVKKAYDVGDDHAQQYLVPRTPETECLLDETKRKVLYNRKEFNILTVSRIDFPHKGFIYGLLQTYIRMKPKYPQLTLTIVGDGPNVGDLKQLLAKTTPEVAKDVSLVGAVSPDQLDSYYADANLLVAVAGCLRLGAKQGVLCLPARHYCYDCEVYGFLPESAAFMLSEEKGMDVEPFIVQAMQMPFEEYIQRSEKTAECCCDDQMPVKTIFEIQNRKTEPILNHEEIQYIRRLERDITGLFARACKMLKREGLMHAVVRRIKRH